MRFAELRSHPMYELLSSKEREFVEMYLSYHGDMEKAIRAVFPRVIRIPFKSLELQRNPSIAAILAFIDAGGKISREELLISLSRIHRNSNSERLKVKTAELIVKLDEFNKPPNREDIKKRMREIDGKRT